MQVVFGRKSHKRMKFRFKKKIRNFSNFCCPPNDSWPPNTKNPRDSEDFARSAKSQTQREI